MSTVDLTDVPALTLLNPWAHLIAHYGKTVENRSWMPHEGVWRLLVHAGKGWDRDHAAVLAADRRLHTSAIVAVADLAHACNTSRWRDTIACGCGEWAQPGQCHWVLCNVRALSEPVPCSGRQGLWQPTADVRAAVERQLVGESVTP